MTGRGRPRKAPSAAKGHKLPEPIPELFEITDTMKKKWIIGKKIGSGGFGTVYYASEALKKNSYDYVVKVEYHANGPLFVEMHCYRSIGKPECIAEWTKKHKLPYLGLSPCYGFGSFEYKDAKYRFMVIERYDVDLQKLLEENDKRFPPSTVYQIGISLLNVIEYIHSTGYIHGDIKAANLLLGRKPGTENQVYLVDMGLACKYLQDNTHKKECPDPKKAHNGTPEFTSRDAHRGCFSRRSDLEILCFNLLQWLSGELPWEKFIKDNKKLQQEKEKHMKDINGFLNLLFDDQPSDGMKKLLLHVNQLEFEQEPDYNLCRQILMDELKKAPGELGYPFMFLLQNTENSSHKQGSRSRNPEKNVAKSAGPSSNKENSKVIKSGVEKRKPEVITTLEDGTVPTPAMLEIMNKRAEVKSTKTRRKK